MGVIETGLGGARDATNVFGDQLLLSVITAVGMEHSQALGEPHAHSAPNLVSLMMCMDVP